MGVRGEAWEYPREVAASRTRRTYAKSNSSTYVTVAERQPGASCIFSVFVAGVQLRVTHCTRHSPRRRHEGRTKIGEGCIFVRKPRATGEEGASLMPRVPAYLILSRAPVRLNAGTGMHDKSVLDAYFRERLPVSRTLDSDVTLQWCRTMTWCLHRDKHEKQRARLFHQIILNTTD